MPGKARLRVSRVEPSGWVSLWKAPLSAVAGRSVLSQHIPQALLQHNLPVIHPLGARRTGRDFRTLGDVPAQVLQPVHSGMFNLGSGKVQTHNCHQIFPSFRVVTTFLHFLPLLPLNHSPEACCAYVLANFCVSCFTDWGRTIAKSGKGAEKRRIVDSRTFGVFVHSWPSARI